jgi:hypothetical protein
VVRSVVGEALAFGISPGSFLAFAHLDWLDQL